MNATLPACASFASIFFGVSFATPQDICTTDAQVAVLQGGTSGTLGEPQLELSGEPLIGFPFGFRVSNAPAGAPGLLGISATSSPTPLPGFRATVYPAFPVILSGFVVGSDGTAPPQYAIPNLDFKYCDAQIFAQAFVGDPSGPGGVTFTDGLSFVIGGKDLTGPSPGALVPSQPILDSQPRITNQSQVTLSGTATGAVEVEVQAPGGFVLAPVGGDMFVVDVFLEPDKVNHIFVTGISMDGASSAPASVAITRDNLPPSLSIDFPAAGESFTTPTVDVAGRVSDMLSGFMGLTVTVNGIAAAVDSGIGTNGTFFAPAVPLNAGGSTTITATAQDFAGNIAVTSITVSQADAVGASMTIQSGNAQTGPVDSEVALPLVVRMTKADGVTPFAGKTVAFEVTKSNGGLSTSTGGTTALTQQITTDAGGFATVYWTLGSDAGSGNNRVRATSTDIAGSIDFCASATPDPASRIAVGTGNNQKGEIGNALPMPLRVFVFDDLNGVGGIDVTFTPVQGTGLLNGSSSATVTTDDTGHAEVLWTLGPEPGNQEVEASFTGLAGNPSVFTAVALERDETQPTSFEGTVLDNANRPVGGAICSLRIAGVEIGAVTDVEGRFVFADTFLGGPAELRVDGLSATSLDGDPVPVGTFPSLVFEVVLVANAVNSLPSPVKLPMLDPVNARTYSLTQPTTLSVEGIDGLLMTVQPGSMSIDGQPAPDGTLMSLNQVHFDEIPMPMPDGAAPPFAWTLQPAEAVFDPPVAIEIPNMSGLPPGAVMYFLSFDHDTGRFEIVATGSVSEEGARMVTDPGSGITISGWGGFCPPYPNETRTPIWKDTPSVKANGPGGTGPGASPGTGGEGGGGPVVPCGCNLGDTYFTSTGKLLSFLNKFVFDSGGRECLQLIDPDSPDYVGNEDEFAPEFQFDPDPVVNSLLVFEDCVRRVRECTETMLVSLPPSTVTVSPSLQAQSDLETAGQVLLEEILSIRNGVPRIDPLTVSALSADQHEVSEEILATVYEVTLEFDYSVVPGVPFTIDDGNVRGSLENLVTSPMHSFLDPSLAVVFLETIDASGGTAKLVIIEVDQMPTATATVGGQTMTLDSFAPAMVSNIPAPAGTPLRPVIVTEGVGVIHVSAAEFFLEGVIGGSTDFGPVPFLPVPAFPESIELFVSDTVIDESDPPPVITVQGTMGDGSTQDLSTFASGTAYTSSNPAVATVDSAGTVTAVGKGLAFITASNQGVSTSRSIIFSPDAESTRVEGFVQREDDSPVQGAEVFVSGIGLTTTTDANGFFFIDEVPSDFGDLTVTARAMESVTVLSGSVTGISPIEGGISDAGIIVLTEVVTWTGGGDGSSWEDGLNWSTLAAPEADDAVVIDLDISNPTIQLDTGAQSVESLFCSEDLIISGGGSLEVADLFQMGDVLGGSLSIATDGTLTSGTLLIVGSVSLSGGTLDSTRVTPGQPMQELTVTGTSQATGGVVFDADVRLLNGSNLDVTGGVTVNGTMSIVDARLRFQDSDSTLGGTGEVSFVDTSPVSRIYSPNGSFRIAETMTIRGGQGYVGDATSSFTNEGTILAEFAQRILQGTGWSNQGTISGDSAGILQLDGTNWSNEGPITAIGIPLEISGSGWTNSSTIDVTNGTLTMSGAWGMQGLGTINATSMSTVKLQGEFSLSNVTSLNIVDSTVSLEGTLDNQSSMLDIGSGGGAWNLAGGTIEGGSVVGDGELTVTGTSQATGGVVFDADVRLLNGSDLDVTGGLTMNGTMYITQAQLRFLDSGSTLGGTGEVRFENSSSGSRIFSPNGSFTIAEAMTIRGDQGFVGDPTSTFTNEGTILAELAQRTLEGTGWSNQGTVEATSGAPLIFEGSYTQAGDVTVNASSTLTANGAYVQTGGSTLLDGGTLTSTFPIDLQGGTFGGSGVTNADLDNVAGLVQPGVSPGTLTLNGDYSQQSAGTLAIEIDGLTAGSGYDQLVVSGTASFGGTLSITTGFSPSPGATFLVVTYGGTSGAFTTDFGGGPVYTLDYGASALELTAP